MEVEKLTDEIFRVISETNHDTVYTVDLSVPKCTCTHWATSRNKLIAAARAQNKPDSTVTFECKHVRAAKVHAGDAVHSEREKLAAKKEEILGQYKKQANKNDLKALMRELAGGTDNT